MEEQKFPCETCPMRAKYEESGLWLADYEADENGEIPQDLKRGVLSQDALYDLFEQALYGEHRVWIRPKDNFFEEVLHEGQMVPRFQPVHVIQRQ